MPWNFCGAAGYASALRSWPGSGPKGGRFRPQNMPGWFHPGFRNSSVVRAEGIEPSRPCGPPVIKQVALVYASLAKRTASTLPGPFLETVFFFGRALMMLIAEASSCVFKCAA